MATQLPAIGLVAVPGRRRRTVDLAREIEQRGFSGIYCPSLGDGVALCEALALLTERIPFGTAIAPIYYRQPEDYAQTVSFIHEVSGGRFRFGIGVAHAPSLARRGLAAGRPLADTREFVQRLRATEGAGELPPVVLATLRRRMTALAGEIGDGLVFANAARSHMGFSLAALPAARTSAPDFLVANMIPTCVDDDLDAARAVNRRTLSSYALLPNYRNYWREAGYGEEMDAVERCIAEGRTEHIGPCLSDQWLDDTTIAGPASRVREEVEKWYAAGVSTPILVPSSARGGQLKAFEELFAVFA
ncbi:MAG: LLM class flavin-dependent oxidoreductase [Gammaproteobacteria bacterium]|nr:LLM class flavin-dependent oxidoreductase [Gammaproteobacteria bacterium]